MKPDPLRLNGRTNCPSCASTTFDIILEESYSAPALQSYLTQAYEGRADLAALAPYSYDIVRCGKCRLAFQRHVPDDGLLTAIYENWILPSEKDRLHRNRELAEYRLMAEEVQYLIRHFGRNPFDIQVLDFGMGWAEWASMARAFGCRVAGAELSRHRIDHARSIGIEVIDWQTIAARKFDFINTEQVFEHLVDPAAVLRHLAGALAPGGLLRISVPDSRKALGRLASGAKFADLDAAEVMPVAPLEHINSFDHASLVAMARPVGLRLVSPSLRALYDSSSGWFSSLRNTAKLAARPVYRHVYPKSTIAYFTPADPQT